MWAKITLFVLTITFSLLSVYNPEKPKILIIGDSISMGYTPFVKETMMDQADVFHNPGNAQHTGTGLAKIEEWVGDEQWDIIQFNWGLWDLCYRHPDSKVYGNRDKINGQIIKSIEEYTSNLDSIVVKLKTISKSKLIFVTTTYVPEKEAGRFSEDALKYNKAAIEVMKKHNVQVNDIYAPSISIHKEHGKAPDDVHYTQEGYNLLGKLIVDTLRLNIE